VRLCELCEASNVGLCMREEFMSSSSRLSIIIVVKRIYLNFPFEHVWIAGEYLVD